MAASEENSALFPIFILTIMAIPLVPYTFMKLCRAASNMSKCLHCQCTECLQSGKYRKSIFKRISNFSTWSNLTLVSLWVIMIVLVYYYIKNMIGEIQVFEPFSILRVEPGASDSEIKKDYRRLSIQYHPDKNPDPGLSSSFEKGMDIPMASRDFKWGLLSLSSCYTLTVLMEGSFYCGLWVSVFFCLSRSSKLVLGKFLEEA